VIGGLRGTLAAFELNSDAGADVMIDVKGVGYEVLVGARCAASLPPVGDEVELAIYTHVREGVFALFGFPDRAERRLFSIVITAHGVGPALGLAILGSLSPSSLTRAVTTGDVEALTLVPGVGKKTAQRLILDLSERFGSVRMPPALDRAAIDGDGDLGEALTSLGYGPEDIRTVLGRISEIGTLEHRLRLALRELAPAAVAR
jgi:Holliday junction DNA helicase RuvA